MNFCLNLSAYICVYVCMHMCSYLCICMHMYACKYLSWHEAMCLYEDVYVGMHVYVCVCACAYAYVIVHAYALKSKFSRSFLRRSEGKCIVECRTQTYVGACAY